MNTHGRRRRVKQPKFHPLSFGGWPDYQQWADNDFRPCPQPRSEPEPEPVPEPVPLAEQIATTVWGGAPVVQPPPPEEPLSPPGWQAFAPVEPEPEPAVWEAFTVVNLTPVTDRPPPVATRRLEGPEIDPHWADDDLVVRPYIRTSGRVVQGHDLRLETLVSVTRLHEREPANPALTQDVLLICDLCRAAPQSVAEVSAYLNTPLGVTRVLIADAIDAGMVTIGHGTAMVDARPSLELLERIREGLLRM